VTLFTVGMLIINRYATNKAAWALGLLGLVLIAAPIGAHDHDHPELNEWYAGLIQPDNPTVSCCGEADAYWCDDYARDSKAYCEITDSRVVARRPSVPVGTEIEIPEQKLKWDRRNPTGHSVVFLSSGGAVYCFVQNGGV
jgi:hypothetical protein